MKLKQIKSIEPEWAREKKIAEQFGLSHMILYNLRKAGLIRTLSLRGEGKQYGARLWNIASVREYLAAQEAAEPQSGGTR